MNQILSTKIDTKNIFKRKWFKIQLYFSMLVITIIIIVVFIYINNLSKNEKLSNSLIQSYNIYKLYSSSSSYTYSKEYNSDSFNAIFGIIEIPKIGIYYPIFSHLNEELLKISPCKFFGESLNKNGNICIAGHNYDNSMFFSKLSILNKDDELFIFDNNGTKYIYKVTNIYEVSDSDLSPIFNYENGEKILTLVTCNNINSNRIILRAKQY